MTGSIDNVALLPAYLAGGTAVLALLVDLPFGGRPNQPAGTARRATVTAVTWLGMAATGVAAVWVGRGPVRETFCAAAGCSYRADHRSALVAVLFAGVSLGVLMLSGPALRDGLPPGEYCFLLSASMAGGVALGYTRDLISLIVALETLTLPLYVLVGLHRPARPGAAEGAVSLFVISVISTAVSLLGAALLYAATGAVHFAAVRAALAGSAALRQLPLTAVAVALLVAGVSFKLAAVPLHAWAPAAYDGAPVPVAAYLSTASKLGGVVAVVYLATDALGPSLPVAGPVLAGLAVATMTVGNLVALRQTRMVRLLAWSSIAQAGYILAPLGALALARGRTGVGVATAVTATLGYTVFYLLLELGAFAAVVALRHSADGGAISQYAGAARRAPWVTTMLALALIGLAGLPPGLAGLFAKVVVVRSVLADGSAWLALAVAVNAVIGLAYYLRVVAVLFAADADPQVVPAGDGVPSRVGWPVRTTLVLATVAALVVGVAPQLVLDVVSR